MIKRILSVMLSALMVISTGVSLFGITSYADDTQVSPDVDAGADFIETDGEGHILSYHNDDGYVLPEYVYRGPLRASSTDSRFDSREEGFATAVKDQGNFGTCWAFSCIASSESSLLATKATINGGEAISVDTLDLSELHLAYFFYHYAPDPMGLMAGDYTLNINPNADWMNVGGNGIFTTFALAQWRAAAVELVAPYTNASAALVLDSSLQFTKTAHLI